MRIKILSWTIVSNNYEGDLKSFRPQYEDGSTRQ